MGRELARVQHGQRGMTLVEIMITLVISSIIAASTFMFFAGQQRIYETQTKLLNVQQNLWAAMEVVSRYTRASGSGMFECVRPASYANTNENDQGASRFQSTDPSDCPVTSDGTKILSLASRPHTGLRAFDSGGNQMQWIPPLWIVDNASDSGVYPNTDILTVAFGNRTSGTDVDAKLAENVTDISSTNDLSLKAGVGELTGNMFRQWEFILLLKTPDWGFGTDPTEDRGCTLLQITGNPTGKTVLEHGNIEDPSTGITWNPGGNVAGMLPNTNYVGDSSGVRNFGQLTWITFYIGTDAHSGIPNLMMQQRHLGGAQAEAQVLAEGIEDLQVAFACDTGSLRVYDLAAVNGELDEGTDDAAKRADEWWNNVPSDVLPAMHTDGFCNLPTAVRITLVARTLTPDDLIDPTASGNGPLDLENHRYDAPRPTDRYRRRVLSTTVYPRNNKPL